MPTLSELSSDSVDTIGKKFLKEFLDFDDCNQNKGKVMKVTLERAKSLGKEECSCSRE